MLSYFTEVYLKRINKDGITQQERVKSRKEKEFNEIFLKKTEYQSKIYQINNKESNIICSLQPNKWNESQLISNILISTNEQSLETGMILKIFQKIKDIEYDKVWLIIFCQENIAKGYYSYKAICLDSIVNITNEYGDTMYSIPVKFVSSTATLVQDYFSQTTKGYREPDRKIKMITYNFPFLKKDTYFIYNEKGFIIDGKDDISIKNVAYVSLDEGLIRENEPRSSENIIISENDNFFLNNR